MKKIKKIVPIFLLAMLFSCFFINYASAEEQSKIILIDPGHGGIDGGSSSKSGILEKDVNLSISLKLKKILEDAGYTVHMTREDDCGLYSKASSIKEKKREDLANRVKMKKDSNCEIFISIHQNTFPQSKYKGAQVWHAPKSELSKNLANKVQSSLKENLDKENNRLPKDAGTEIRVLRNNNKGASILVECGFLSNEEESKLLVDEQYQEKLVNAIKIGLDKYLDETKASSGKSFFFN
ncbi:MAG: N-acetylmuramoyl-L-alanine amidase CwlD [Sarcina sp.]